jgi:hypothetical protein
MEKELKTEKFSLGEIVFSIRCNERGIIKSVDGNKGYVLSFSKNKYDYEYHYPNEISKV